MPREITEVRKHGEQHTPLPWRLGHDAEGTVNIYAENAVDVVATGMTEADAHVIVDCVNRAYYAATNILADQLTEIASCLRKTLG